MSELIIRQPSEELKQKLDDVATSLRNGASLVDEVFTLGREEGFSDKEIGQMVRDRLVQLGYNPRSIRRLLPLSAKDLTKSRKNNLVRDQDNGNSRSDGDIMSSSQNSNNFDETQKIELCEMVKKLQANVITLKGQLAQEQMKSEDLSIQCKNGIKISTELRDQLQALREGVRTLILPRDKFPPNCNQVFELQNYVFLVEFKGTKVLDISVTTQQEAYDQYEKVKHVS